MAVAGVKSGVIAGCSFDFQMHCMAALPNHGVKNLATIELEALAPCEILIAGLLPFEVQEMATCGAGGAIGKERRLEVRLIEGRFLAGVLKKRV